MCKCLFLIKIANTKHNLFEYYHLEDLENSNFVVKFGEFRLFSTKGD